MLARALAGLVVSLLCVVATAYAREVADGHDWTIYRNDRYGFSIYYPADVFQLERATEAGDGQVLVSREGDARLLVGTLSNTDRFRPAAYRDHIAKRFYEGFAIKYRRLSASRFVLSGEGKGKAFYEKVVFTCNGRLISSFAMIYPSERRKVFDRLIEGIEKSFQPGSTKGCGHPTQPHARQLRNHPRSGVADRIARSRERDIPRVQRRSDRRYDHKIVRGYGRPYMGR